MKNWEIELKKKFFDNYYGFDDDKDTFSLTEYALNGIKLFIQNLLDKKDKEINEKIIKYHNDFTSAVAIGSVLGGINDQLSDYISSLLEKYKEGFLKNLK